ncbi:hypothetical protein AYI68_g2190 [Smittium mucronatum]|uniref:B box-type domain-containing protein n=1 Tax=Smittium mucronatum TaxID=133383 RepID=A0A1R0H3F4_9FUNG|nr:hypothetical protein AYI68_g2190 [Smittium mucronatum]
MFSIPSENFNQNLYPTLSNTNDAPPSSKFPEVFYPFIAADKSLDSPQDQLLLSNCSDITKENNNFDSFQSSFRRDVCDTHSNMRLEYWCLDCSMGLCEICIKQLDRHKLHSITSLASQYDLAYDSIYSKMENTLFVADTVANDLSQLENLSSSLDNNYKIAQNQLQAHLDNLEEETAFSLREAQKTLNQNRLVLTEYCQTLHNLIDTFQTFMEDSSRIEVVENSNQIINSLTSLTAPETIPSIPNSLPILTSSFKPQPQEITFVVENSNSLGRINNPIRISHDFTISGFVFQANIRRSRHKDGLPLVLLELTLENQRFSLNSFFDLEVGVSLLNYDSARLGSPSPAPTISIPNIEWSFGQTKQIQLLKFNDSFLSMMNDIPNLDTLSISISLGPSSYRDKSFLQQLYIEKLEQELQELKNGSSSFSSNSTFDLQNDESGPSSIEVKKNNQISLKLKLDSHLNNSVGDSENDSLKKEDIFSNSEEPQLIYVIPSDDFSICDAIESIEDKYEKISLKISQLELERITKANAISTINKKELFSRDNKHIHNSIQKFASIDSDSSLEPNSLSGNPIYESIDGKDSFSINKRFDFFSLVSNPDNDKESLCEPVPRSNDKKKSRPSIYLTKPGINPIKDTCNGNSPANSGTSSVKNFDSKIEEETKSKVAQISKVYQVTDLLRPKDNLDGGILKSGRSFRVPFAMSEDEEGEMLRPIRKAKSLKTVMSSSSRKGNFTKKRKEVPKEVFFPNEKHLLESIRLIQPEMANKLDQMMT